MNLNTLYIFDVAFNSVNIIAAIFIMHVYIKIKEFRKTPGDFFVIIALISTLYSLASLYAYYEMFFHRK